MSLSANYFLEDTVAAIASEAGGAIVVIRLSGPKAIEIAQKITKDKKEWPSSKAILRKLYSQKSELLDEALVIPFYNPKSFTGEDCVEFHVHGGRFISSRVLQELIDLGARQAKRGEFSFRSVKNGKLSLIQATAIPDLINAENSGATSLALEKLAGFQNQLIASIQSELMRLSAFGELGIDFSDQGIDELEIVRLKSELRLVVSKLEKIEKSFSRGSRIQDGVKVALIGLPNAGKSSLFNALLGEERAIVSEIAGTTRDVVKEKITLTDEHTMVTFRLADTAGIRKSEDQIEKMGIERSQLAAIESELILFLVDASSLSSKREEVSELWKTLHAPFDKTIFIFTKCDQAEVKESSFLNQKKWALTSAVTGDGIANLVSEMVKRVKNLVNRESGEFILTRIDQQQAIRHSLLHLDRALQSPELDLFAADLRQSLHALSPLIGEITSDDILSKIFSEFCIGK